MSAGGLGTLKKSVAALHVGLRRRMRNSFGVALDGRVKIRGKREGTAAMTL